MHSHYPAHTGTCIHRDAHRRINTQRYTHTFTLTETHRDTHRDMRTHTHTHTKTQTRTQTHADTHTDRHTLTHRHTYSITHSLARSLARSLTFKGILGEFVRQSLRIIRNDLLRNTTRWSDKPCKQMSTKSWLEEAYSCCREDPWWFIFAILTVKCCPLSCKILFNIRNDIEDPTNYDVCCLVQFLALVLFFCCALPFYGHVSHVSVLDLTDLFSTLIVSKSYQSPWFFTFSNRS